MPTFNGMNIIESHFISEIAKLKLSHDFTACSEGMKHEMNAWLLEQFGTYLPCYVIGGNEIVMHPRHIEMLKKQDVFRQCRDFNELNLSFR